MRINFVVDSMSDQGRQVQSMEEKFDMVICAFGSRGWRSFLQYKKKKKSLRFSRQDSDKGDTTWSLLLCHQLEHLNNSPVISTQGAQKPFTETHLGLSPNDNRRECSSECQGKELTHQCCGAVPWG